MGFDKFRIDRLNEEEVALSRSLYLGRDVNWGKNRLKAEAYDLIKESDRLTENFLDKTLEIKETMSINTFDSHTWSKKQSFWLNGSWDHIQKYFISSLWSRVEDQNIEMYVGIEGKFMARKSFTELLKNLNKEMGLLSVDIVAQMRLHEFGYGLLMRVEL